MDWQTNSDTWAALLSLTVMEIVLGIDNIIFISILASRLPEHQRQKARVIGLGLAMITRIALLCSLAWVMSLTKPLFLIAEHGISGRDLLLLLGGVFLVGKATKEIHNRIEDDEDELQTKAYSSFAGTLVQIAILDIVFSLDSVITAVGMVDQIWVMIVAVIVSILIMMIFATPVSNFIHKYPTVKMLALSFLLLIGVVLIAEGFGQHISKAYIYAAMAFSIFVEILNLAASARKKKRKLPL
ncbi:MAG: TerC family protein [Candidatus Obscuribacterales bacterium]|nr:TerC family protein [Candidatus Obscuribacterales bacterium]